MNNMNEDFFIHIPNKFWNMKDKLTKKDTFVELLFLYSYILTEKSYSRNTKQYSSTRTTINHMHEDVKFSTSHTHPDENKKKLKTLLFRLKELEWLHFDNDKIGYNDIINIKILNPHEDMGYQKVHAHIFESCIKYGDYVTPSIYAVLCYIKKCEGYKSNISYEEFADKICRSYSSTVRTVQGAELQGLIHVDHGRYYVDEDEKFKQEKNGYKINDKEERNRQLEAWNPDNKVHLELDNFIYALKHKEKDKKLASLFEKRLGIIRSSPTGDKLINDMLEKAIYKIEQESA